MKAWNIPLAQTLAAVIILEGIVTAPLLEMQALEQTLTP